MSITGEEEASRLRLLLLADLHLGHPLDEWGDRAEARALTLRQALVDAVTMALDPSEGIQAVLIAGDLFDHPDPEPALRDFFMEQLVRLDEGGRPVVILPGNHDALSHPRCLYSTLELPGTATLVDWPARTRVEISLGEETLHLYSLTWVPGRTPPSPWEGLRRHQAEGAHVALLHARLDSGLAPEEAGVPLFIDPVVLADSGLDLVVLGRPHNYSEQRFGETVVVAPGSPVGFSLDECGDRFFTVVDVDASGVRVDPRPRSESTVGRFPLDPGPNPQEPELARRIGEMISHSAMAEVVLSGKVERPLSLDIIEAALPAGTPLLRLVDETELHIAPAPFAGEFEERSVRDLFLDDMNHRLEAAAGLEDRAAIDDAKRIVLEALTHAEKPHAH